jgi:hypothetical protein
MNQNDVENNIFEDCNLEEIKLLKHRHELEQWFCEDIVIKQML